MAALTQHQRVELASLRVEAECQAAKADAVAYVAKTAMQNAALISQLEGQLSQLVPLATSRLQAIGDLAALALADVVAESARRMRS